MRFCEAEGCSYPVFSTDKLTKKGYCKSHANKFRTDLDRRTIIQRAMAKQKTLNSAIRGLNKPEKEESNVTLWFLSKRHQMTGKCVCGCNGNSSKYDDKYWKFSAAHVLAKAKFKSIAWHPDNWIELAFWGGCHTIFDDKGYEYCKTTKPTLWNIVVDKFKILYPFIHHSEYKHIPNVLLETLINI